YGVNVYNGPCKASDSVNVVVHPIPIPGILSTQKLCIGDSEKISASGGGRYLWNNGDTTAIIVVSPIKNTSYKVIVSNGFCSATDSTTVLVYNYPKPVIIANKNMCQGNSDSISVSGGSAYLWNNGQTDSLIIVKPSASTNYNVIIYNGPCSISDSIYVNVNPIPIITLCCDTVIMMGRSVLLSSSGGGMYSWSPSAGLNCNSCDDPTASPINTITYTLTITSDSGCISSKKVTIDVTCGTVFVPEAFSPGNNGHNDVLYVRGNCINTLDFIVFDRWGNKVFETNDKSIGWDGNYKGSPMNTGSYSYLLTATEYDGSVITRHGNITLVR
ncbi:MAG TPA: gliding motility-associated C-terminal domain-containing protein, partial [Bacteroidia bacterium]|nr:gliding motility-associated C-terminal domain-containing protein [Bacteroidia bacterium]